jgi:RND family efflux transporter MFP subunit
MIARELRVALSALGLLALASGCGGAKSAAKEDASSPAPALLAATDVAVVSRTDVAAGVPVSGTLTPVVDIRITAPLGEVLESVRVREGQAVAQGEVLARFRVASLEPAAASARAARQIAAADYERMKNLYQEGAVAERDVQSAEAALRAAEASEAQALKRFEDATVRAPVAGVIAQRWVQAGDRVGEADPLFQLVNVSELEFEATVPTQYVASVRPGSPVQLSVTGYPAGSIGGRVARVNATADPATRQVKVYVSVPNPGGRLVGGLFASGNVVTRQSRHTLAVPSAAVRRDARGAFAMVVQGGRLARHELETGVRDEIRDLVEVVAGLQERDTVVTGPIEGLNVGQPVRLAGKGI